MTTPADLVARVLAAITAAEDDAKAATPGPWRTFPDIARHDPEAVLRRCAADREIVAEHTPVDDEPGAWCERCVDRDYFPCPTLRALARGYGIEVTP